LTNYRPSTGYNEPLKKVPHQGRENKERAHRCYIEYRQQCGEDMIIEANG